MSRRLNFRTLISAVVIFAAACGGPPSQAEADRGAKPEFCSWAAQIQTSVPPTPPPVDPDLPLDVDRLVDISEHLSTFAGTLETAAAFAPVATQAAFTELASFNREVAGVITGDDSLRERSSDAARRAARVVARTLDDECGVQIDVQSTMAFFEG